MRIRDLLAKGRSFSFEFFPPKTPEGEQQLWEVITEDLAPLRPTFVSVTFGAGGSTRDRTLWVVERISQESDITPMAHLTTVGVSRDELTTIVHELATAGIENILALRGDPPRDQGEYVPHPDGLPHAVDLVRLVHELYPGRFSVGVAAFPEVHPDAPDMPTDVRYLVEKVEAGADFAITQFFFEARHYWQLLEEAQAAGLPEGFPVVPGIMPVTNVKQIQRMAELSGADFPAWLAAELEAAGDDAEAMWRIGVEQATRLCAELLDGGAPGLHFYTLNKSPATRQIYAGLGLPQH